MEDSLPLLSSTEADVDSKYETVELVVTEIIVSMVEDDAVFELVVDNVFISLVEGKGMITDELVWFSVGIVDLSSTEDSVWYTKVTHYQISSENDYHVLTIFIMTVNYIII